MNLFTLFEKLYVEQPELFQEASQLYRQPDDYRDPMIPVNENELSLYAPQLGKVATLIKETDEFKRVENLFFIDSPMFMIDHNGYMLKDSPTLLGDAKVKSMEALTYREDPGLIHEFADTIYLYNITVRGISKNLNTEYLESIKCGAVFHRLPMSDKRVLIVKYDPQAIGEYTKLQGEELLSRISSNIGNSISELIQNDKSTVEKAKTASIRLASVKLSGNYTPPNKF